MRRLAPLVVVALLLGACASDTSSDGPTTTAAAEAAAAPDFTLALADGGVFRLSDEQRPVYMIFWAEW